MDEDAIDLDAQPPAPSPTADGGDGGDGATHTGPKAPGQARANMDTPGVKLLQKESKLNANELKRLLPLVIQTLGRKLEARGAQADVNNLVVKIVGFEVGNTSSKPYIVVYFSNQEDAYMAVEIFGCIRLEMKLPGRLFPTKLHLEAAPLNSNVLFGGRLKVVWVRVDKESGVIDTVTNRIAQGSDYSGLVESWHDSPGVEGYPFELVASRTDGSTGGAAVWFVAREEELHRHLQELEPGDHKRRQELMEAYVESFPIDGHPMSPADEYSPDGWRRFFKISHDRKRTECVHCGNGRHFLTMCGSTQARAQRYRDQGTLPRNMRPPLETDRPGREYHTARSSVTRMAFPTCRNQADSNKLPLSPPEGAPQRTLATHLAWRASTRAATEINETSPELTHTGYTAAPRGRSYAPRPAREGGMSWTAPTIGPRRRAVAIRCGGGRARQAKRPGAADRRVTGEELVRLMKDKLPARMVAEAIDTQHLRIALTDQTPSGLHHRLATGEPLALPLASAGHWLTAAIWPTARAVYIFDPLGSFPDETREAIELGLPGYIVHDVSTPVQTDSYNCGMWAAEFAHVWYAMVQTEHTAGLDPRAVPDLRTRIATHYSTIPSAADHGGHLRVMHRALLRGRRNLPQPETTPPLHAAQRDYPRPG
jgi:hypothetical protein